jgi:hypothetical protein
MRYQVNTQRGNIILKIHKKKKKKKDKKASWEKDNKEGCEDRVDALSPEEPGGRLGGPEVHAEGGLGPGDRPSPSNTLYSPISHLLSSIASLSWTEGGLLLGDTHLRGSGISEVKQDGGRSEESCGRQVAADLAGSTLPSPSSHTYGSLST